MLPVEVDSGSYVDAVSELAGADRSIVDLMSTLTSTLSGCGAMAGTDTGGEEWAGQYDPAAAQLVDAGCKLADALASMANLLNGSLSNHEGGNYSAMIYPGEPVEASGDTLAAHATESLSTSAPPSAVGGTGDQPSWWHWIASHVEGLLWPDADTGKLRTAGAAWLKAAESLSLQQYCVDAAESAMYAISSPEMDDVHGACQEMRTHIGDVATAFANVGQACNDYAQHVDDKHQEVLDELTSFIEWTIAIEAAGGILSVVTVGISEAAAQAAEAAEIANAATKVIRILNELIELARTVKAAIETAIESIGALIARLGKFISAKLVTAIEDAGSALTKLALRDGEVPLTAAEKDAITGLPKGARPDPSIYLPEDYINGHLAPFEDGVTRFMTKSNLDKYGIAQRDGTSFVMPTSEVDQLIAKTGGDPRAMEQALGLPDHFFDGKVVRVDVKDPDEYGLRMPSGNEAGANDEWIPGGQLPTGISEAVIDGGKVDPGDISVAGFPPKGQ